jgi:hypothetical protein
MVSRGQGQGRHPCRCVLREMATTGEAKEQGHGSCKFILPPQGLVFALVITKAWAEATVELNEVSKEYRPTWPFSSPSFSSPSFSSNSSPSFSSPSSNSS